MNKIDSLLAIGIHNEKVEWLIHSKKNYESICKEIDDILIEIENTKDNQEKDKLILRKLRPLKVRYEMAYNLYTQNEIAYGNLERNDSIYNTL